MTAHKRLLELFSSLNIDVATGPKNSAEWESLLNTLNVFTASMESDRDLLTKSLEATAEAVQEGFRKSDGLKTRMMESEAELRALISSSPLGLFLSDPKGNISYVNRKFCEITGYDSENAFTRDWFDYIHPDDREEFLVRWQLMEENPKTPIECDVRFIKTYEGSTVSKWGNVKVSAITIKKRITGFLGTVDDISERKRAEALLLGEKQVLEMISRNVPQKNILESTLQLIETYEPPLKALICEISKQSKYPSYLASINVPEEVICSLESVEYNFDKLQVELMQYEQPEKNYLKLNEDEQWKNMVTQAKSKNLLSCYALPIRDSRLNLVGLFIFFQESQKKPSPNQLDAIEFFNDLIPISIEKKNMQVKLEDEQMRMISASKMASLGEMAGGIAHEVMNPIAIIDGFAARIQRMIQSKKIDEESLATNIDKIRSTVARVTKIITSLRTFARDGEKDSYVTTKISDLIDDTLEFCNQRLRYRRIELKVLPFDHEMMVDCQPIQISQVILNLLNNATDAIDELKEKWIRIEVANLGDKCQIKVVDSGPGIRDDLYDKIMKPYFTTKPLGKGTGLGLSLSKSIVESHKGTLTIDRKNPNTCFVIEIPKRQKFQKPAA